MLILSEARTHLARYSGRNNDFAERINLVIERYLKAGNWRGTKQLVRFAVYTDRDGRSVITLPRQFNTILAGAFSQNIVARNGLVSFPLMIRNEWYEFLSGSGCQLPDDGFVPVPGRFVTFTDWTTPMLLRAKFETPEIGGKIVILGTLNGQTIFSSEGQDYGQGVSLVYSGTATATTTQQFDLPPHTVIKPVTRGRVSLYTVDGSNVETLVAVYDPNETTPAWRRYHVTASCCQSTDPACPVGQFVADCKKEFIFVTDENGELAISNLGALRMGLEALQKEDADDDARADKKWFKGQKLLADESEDDTGAGALGTVQVNDDFDMAGIGRTDFWPGGHYG